MSFTCGSFHLVTVSLSCSLNMSTSETVLVASAETMLDKVFEKVWAMLKACKSSIADG